MFMGLILMVNTIRNWILIWSTFCVTGLLDLANAYCEEALKRHCERIIRHGITTENAAMLYAVAIKYEATVLVSFWDGY